jgi:vitamin B12 transporter
MEMRVKTATRTCSWWRVFLCLHTAPGGYQEKLMKKVLFFALCGLLLTAAGSIAAPVTLDPIVVTATRTATPLSQVASSVTVITSDEIEAKQQQLVIDVLRDVPGVNISRTGGPGGAASIYLRGTENKHTLILIDGVEVNNPSAVGGVADLTNLSSDNIEQIEVVRGAQSVLYGSDAIGGVINIITRKGQREPQGYASFETGSFNTQTGKVGFSTGSDKGHFSLAMARTKSDGFSSANEENGNTEDDSYERTSLGFNAGFRPSQTFELNFGANYSNSDNEFDYGFSNPPIDAENYQDTKELTGHIEGIAHFLDDRWKVKLGASYTDIERITVEAGWGTSRYEGKKSKFELQNIVTFNKFNTLVVGIENETDKAETSYGQDDSVTNNAIYAENQFKYDNFSTTVGLRHDKHDEFGDHTTWRVAPVYVVETTKTKLKGSVGTGFKAPTLYELYAPGFYDWFDPSIYYSVGNDNLEPEESLSWDLGIEQPLFQNAVILGVTWFQNQIDNYIDYDFVIGYQNTHDIRTQGVESSIQLFPSEYFDVQFNYTYTDTKNEANDSRLLRRPLHNASAGINITPNETVRVNANLQYIGERDGYQNAQLKAYTLVNMAASYQIKENLQLFGRVDNLFDKSYEEVAGYGTAGVSGYAGIKLTF